MTTSNHTSADEGAHDRSGPKQHAQPRTPAVPVAGIGASAGGMEALKAFFSALPSELGIAFVVVVHLSPEHRSELAPILARSAKIPVEEVNATLPLAADRVYVIAPDRRLEITDAHVSAHPFDEPRGQRAPIDTFFRSLAAQHGDGFAVILSGGGSDGAVGIKAIKEQGGLVLVQEPSEAAFDAMPRAAIATGLADLVLPVRALAARMGELARSKLRLRKTLGPMPLARLDEVNEAALKRILAHLQARTGHDFSHYKRTTVMRRIARRMQVYHQETLSDYHTFLRHNAEEAQALFDDMLISVTTFFRDPAAWEALRQRILGPLFESKVAAARPLRVWVPGCATGEEAYSLAMLLLEEIERREQWLELQIFASDLDAGALATAREGRYPAAIAADISEVRLGRFFRREDDHYCVTKELRDCILFASHSLLKDPPFSRLDLISCRNLLIYLDRKLQEQIFGIFHYALKSGGYLFLGASENAEGAYFHILDKTHHLFQAREVAEAAAPLELLIANPHPHPQPLPGDPEPRPKPPAAVAMHSKSLEDLAPPSILVNGQHQVMHLSETAGRYLQPPAGPFSRDIIELARPELQHELRTALYRAFDKHEVSLSPFVPVAFNGALRRVALWVRPRRGQGREWLALVVFIEGGDAIPADTAVQVHDDNAVSPVHEELRQTQKRLRSTQEEYETANEELRAANEELQSINEEYRSTTEELETSKEELQSINEELQTVNSELKNKLDEVSRAHNDLENLMTATEIGTLFLDRQLRIQRFTPPVAALFNIKTGDRGRPISDLTHRLDYQDLEADARQVLAHLAPVEREAQSQAGRSYYVRLRPYRTLDDRIDGVIITFVDITERRKAEQALRRSEQRYRLLVDSAQEYAIFMLNPDGRISSWNLGAERIFGYSAAEVVGENAHMLFTADERAAGVPQWEMETAVNAGRASDDRWQLRKDGSLFWAGGVLEKLVDDHGTLQGFAKVLRDNTERKQAEEALKQREAQLQRQTQELRKIDQQKNQFLGMLGHELRNPLAAIRNNLQVLASLGVEAPANAPMRQSLAALERQSQHMTRLVNDLLDITRINKGKITLQRQPVSVAEAVEEVVTALRLQLAAACLRLDLRLPETPMYLDVDPVRFTQMLDNLVGNAVKYTDSGGAITLAAEPLEDEVVIRVRDTGIGIAPEALPGLFDPFSQVDASQDHTQHGLGLGLALVKSLVELHGGGVEAHSDGLGKGSEFRIRLPRAEARAAPPAVTPHPAAPAAPGSDQRQRILVVDDNRDIVDPFTTLLSSLGYEVEATYDGETALAIARQLRPTVAFVDIGMPGMDGYQLARQLRQTFPPEALTLVAVTGYGRAEDITRIRETGFDHHLLKPVDMDTISELLDGLN